ncbi:MULTISPECIES: beta family protein [Paenibacillus]|uniref:beta family protein n=1 Tax=Paenibacillus TaxID=44249 RepID=UPI0004019474|nr:MULTISPECIES: beta family protein [Paenibacillus]UMY55382.1 beta family protein [Paenibacillus peoriae]
MLEKHYYVPVLKWKQGEQKALEELPISIKEATSPMLEVPPIDWDFENDTPKKTIDEHLQKVGETLSRSWGSDSPFFIDLYYIDSTDRLANGQHPLSFVLQETRTRGLNAIPVTSTNRDVAYQAEVRSAHQQDQNGICFRLKEEDFGDLQNNIGSLLTQLSVNPSEVDLVLDYEYVKPDERVRTMLFLTGILSSIPFLNQWRRLVLCGTSFPSDLSSIDSNSIGQIDRAEWLIWKRLIYSGSIERVPSFGDYAISNPAPFEADPRFINMSANIRYTGDDKFIIFKGRMIKRYGGNQYYQLASQVVTHPEYSGPNFSAGDQYIQNVANNTDGPGNATNWRKTGTNHHITYVVNELATVTLP